jgi:hypothetical protein
MLLLSDGNALGGYSAAEHAMGSGGEQAFPPELLAIWADPGIRKLAVRRAGDLDLAQDALLETVCAVARVQDLRAINDLRAYFCRALINSVYRLRGQLATADPCDPASLTELAQPCTGTSGRPLDESAVTRLMAQAWLQRFRTHRDRLRAAVPARSSQPDRYRDLITRAAEYVLRAILDGSISQADSNEALQFSFPEWFGRPGDAANTCHQHLSRARHDIRTLLRTVINREELLP